MFLNFKMNEGDVCLADCVTTHTILREKKLYFFNLITTNTGVSTISDTSNLIEGSERVNRVLPNGTRFHINDALYSSKSRRNLLSFKDIRRNGYHIETMNEGNNECLYITSIISGKKIVTEKLSAFSSGLYHTTIKSIESNVVVNQKFNNPKIFNLWHDRLGHPESSMIRRIIEHSNEHPLKNQKILLPNELACEACSQGKLIVRPSINKIMSKSPVFLERIHRDICGPIHPPCGPFCYFMVIIHASTRWSHVCHLSTRNVTFVRLLAQIIKLKAHFQTIQLRALDLTMLVNLHPKLSINFVCPLG